MQKAIEVYLEINSNQVDKTFTYLITSEEFSLLKIGMSVVVDFNHREEIGYVNKIIDVNPDAFSFKLKPIKMIAKEQMLTKTQVKLIEYLMFNFNVNFIKALDLVYPKKMRKLKKYQKKIKLNTEAVISGYRFNNKQILENRLQSLTAIYQEYNLLTRSDLLKLDPNLTDYQIKKAHSLGYLTKVKAKQSEFDLLKVDYNKKILTKEQLESLKKINASVKDALLYGTMGSGKTEIIKYLIRDLKDDEQILILEPNQLLREQIYERLNQDFSSQVVRYDQTSNNANVIYEQIKNNNARIIIGLSNSLFAPFKNLKLVMFDEEHDFNYEANSFEYKTKSVLNYLKNESDFKIIYASATPSLVTLYEAKQKQIELVVLKQKYYKTKVKWKYSKLDSYETFLTSETLLQIREQLRANHKVLILHNRLGYATRIECESCLRIPICPHCQKPLNYYQDNFLKCHYCNYKIKFKNHCSRCNQDNTYKLIGVGIEQVHEALHKYFADYPIHMVDSNTKVKKRSEIIKEFAEDKPQILLGTSLVASGIDFKKITLAVVTNIDYSLNDQNYNRELSAYQLLKQLSGRIGKGTDEAEILIQTKYADNQLFNMLEHEMYDDYAKLQMNNRYLLKLSPFTKYFKITIISENEQTLQKDIRNVINYLRQKYKIIYHDFCNIRVKRIGDKFYLRYEICFEITNNFTASDLNNLNAIQLQQKSTMQFNPNFTNIT